MITFTDTMRSTYPSIFATAPAANVSSRYSFVSSEELIHKMGDMGWQLNRIMNPRSRKENTKLFGKHKMIFRNPDAPTMPDPRNPSKNMFFEILATNSHDGRSALKFEAGIFTLVCSNGLTIKSTDLGNMYTSHVNINRENLDAMISRFNMFVDHGVRKIEAFAKKELSADQAIAMAEFVAKARFGQDPSKVINPQELLMTRRTDDNGSSVWTYMNVIQENLMRGGVVNRNNRRTRQIRNMDLSNKINDYVWLAAEQVVGA
jgi:hypothetical protein